MEKEEENTVAGLDVAACALVALDDDKKADAFWLGRFAGVADDVDPTNPNRLDLASLAEAVPTPTLNAA